MNDVNDVIRVMVENKLLNDKQIGELVGTLSNVVGKFTVETYRTDPNANKSLEELISDGFDSEKTDNSLIGKFTANGLLSEEHLDGLSEDEFTAHELQRWRMNVMDKYQSYIDDIGIEGLKNMKKLFTDFFGDEFAPL